MRNTKNIRPVFVPDTFPETLGNTPRTPSIDDTDRQIVRLLQLDARLTTREISKQVALSETPCARRQQLLLERGVIRRHTVTLDRHKLGLGVHAFVAVSRNKAVPREQVWRDITSLKFVISCHVVTGECDLMLEVVARDLDHYAEVVLQQLMAVPGIDTVNSMISLKDLKPDRALPV